VTTGRTAIGEVDRVEAASQHSCCGLSCCGRILFAEDQTAKEIDDSRSSVDGDGCGGEDGGGGRLVSQLPAEIQLSKDHHNIRVVVFAAVVGFRLRRIKPRRK
jgi:hypothetical protein